MSGPAAGRSVAAFVRARRPAWERLGALTARAGGSRLPLAEVEELDRLYRRAAADLAHARRRFPGSDAEGYLAELIASAYRVLYRPRPRGAALLHLLRASIPAACRRHPGALGLATALLVTGAAGGALAVALDPGAAELLVPLPVREAVAEHRMWTGHLLSAAPGVSGAALLHNNVTVAVLSFGLGLTAGLGTALLLVLNGALLGAVLAHAAIHGMGGAVLAFVAGHGPLELSALLIAAQAGFVLAAALVDPGEWPRRTALQVAGRESAMLLAVVVPALVLAALLEAGVSPSGTFSPQARAVLGLGLAATLWAWLLGPRPSGG
ncbi:MAG TPA: stage II sporulation protein M [Anaeromyxobacter sp.]|nr:stage II sporulation protein M [Anaeromyxobacter sp.]